MMSAKFITFEGLDGAGKTTQVAHVAELLGARGVPVLATREPGGTPVGEKLRELMLARNQNLDPETETLLMFAARREHIDKVIRPALAAGTWVLCDRFTDATFAYQGGGSGVDWWKIEVLEQWVQGELQPDLTLYFDVAPDAARARTSGIKVAPDRFEQEREAFHARVRQAYLQRAQAHPGRIRVVDANLDIGEVRRTVERIVTSVCLTPG
jgi:dTMP kinase